MREPNSAFGHLVLVLLSDTVVSAAGIPLHVEYLLIRGLIDLECLILGIGWVGSCSLAVW